MNNLYHSNFFSSLKSDIAKAKKSITIISPYITLPAVENLLSTSTAKRLKKIIVTLPFGIEYLTGSVELNALMKLRESGFSLMSLEHLHSKIYIIDHKVAYIGSANFTGKGWGLVESSNVEIMTRIELSEGDADEIQTTYLDRCSPLELTDELKQIVSEGHDLKKSFHQLEKKLNDFIREKEGHAEPKDRYQIFLQNLKKQRKISSFVREKNIKEFGKNVFHIKKQGNKFSAKLMYSRLASPDKKYEINYRFELLKTANNQAKKYNLDFIMILEGSEGKENRYVKFPAAFMKNKVLKSNFINKQAKSWQFAISEDQNILFIRCFNGAGEEQKFNISDFENSLF